MFDFPEMDWIDCVTTPYTIVIYYHDANLTIHNDSDTFLSLRQTI